jgi:hypothetical protein
LLKYNSRFFPQISFFPQIGSKNEANVKENARKVADRMWYRFYLLNDGSTLLIEMKMPE